MSGALTRDEWRFLVEGCFNAEQLEALMIVMKALEASRTTGVEPEHAIAAHAAVIVETVIAVVESMPVHADFSVARSVARELVELQLPDVLRAFSAGEGLHMRSIKS